MTTLPASSSMSSSPSAPEATENADRKHVTKLSTSSPEAIRVASEITPNRLANLLIRKGPLAIRLITAQLSVEVPGFDLLSLSKQRRLIMAAMDQGDPENNVVFEKIGWGQWAVRHVDSDFIVTEPNGSLDGNSRMNIHELREKAKLGWSKKAEQASETLPHRHTSAASQSKLANRRDSISNNKTNMHNIRVPGEKLDNSNAISDSEPDSDDEDKDDIDTDQVRSLRMSFVSRNGNADMDDNAIDEDSDEDAMDDDDDDDEGALFNFDDDDASNSSIAKFKKSPPLKFANRVPTKFSPPPALSGNRRKSSSTAASSSVVKNTNHHGSSRHHLFNRSRLNSMDNLDDYILSSARNSSLSVASPPVHGGSIPSTSPLGSYHGHGDYLNQNEFTISSENISAALSNAGRRKSSFNESSIRSTLSSSLPRGHSSLHKSYEHPHVPAPATASESRKAPVRADAASDTDEEDWATMGAETLRKHSSGVSSPANGKAVQSEERTAARALVDLMST